MKQFETGRKYSQVPSIRRVGRPKKFETVEELEDAIQKYFDSCFVKVQRIVHSGLVGAILNVLVADFNPINAKRCVHDERRCVFSCEIELI